VSSLNLNLLLGSYSQGLLVQRAQASRCHSASQGTAESDSANPVQNSQASLSEDDLIKKVEPVALEEQSDDSQILPDKKKTILERFSEQVEDRLSKSKKYDHVAASIELEKLVSEASQIGESLGQAKANEFMNKVLVAADDSTAQDSIDLAIESFFKQSSQSAMVNPTAYQKLEDAKKTFSDIYNQEPADPDLSQESSETQTNQSKLYQNYTSGRRPGPFTKSFLANPLGNLVNQVA
jgi:hypothetical protein